MGLHDFIAWAFLAAACYVTGFGLVLLVRAIRRERQRRICAAYRAASLVIESKRGLRAAQHRAAEREWGRAA